MKDGCGPITNREIGINLNTDVTSFKKMCLKTWHKSSLPTTSENRLNLKLSKFIVENFSRVIIKLGFNISNCYNIIFLQLTEQLF